jgi:hypothetical protein
VYVSVLLTFVSPRTDRPAALQALIQFNDVTSATAAKKALDGQSLYTGCCTLRIEFSNLQQLTVKYNGDKVQSVGCA